MFDLIKRLTKEPNILTFNLFSLSSHQTKNITHPNALISWHAPYNEGMKTHLKFFNEQQSHWWSNADMLQTWWAVWQWIKLFGNLNWGHPWIGGMKIHMLPFKIQPSHVICLNHPLTCDTVQGLDDWRQRSHLTPPRCMDTTLLMDMIGGWLEWLEE